MSILSSGHCCLRCERSSVAAKLLSGCSSGLRRRGQGTDRLGRQTESEDCAQRLPVLSVEGPSRVREIVLVAQRADAQGDLGVAVARQVREEVMFDLIAQTAGHHL